MKLDRHDSYLDRCLEAAKFLSNLDTQAVSSQEEREILVENEGDPEAAALQIYGIEVTSKNIKALQSVVSIKDLHKSNPIDWSKDLKVTCSNPHSQDVFEEVKRAIDSENIKEVELGGKFSSGSTVVKDPETFHTYILKVDSGKVSPAAGISERETSSATCEAAFWWTSKIFGLERFLPRADLLIINGIKVAAIRMLPLEYQTLEKLSREDPNLPSRAINPYIVTGDVTKWAILDYILGQTDRHGNNLMVDQGTLDIRLIDHGATFAGESFSPAFDSSTFIPYYLRANTKTRDFMKLELEEKLQRMPTVTDMVRAELIKWVDNIHEVALKQSIERYGIDSTPELHRLERLKTYIKAGSPPDVAINYIWISS